MPQMMPLNWLNLYIYFYMLFWMMMILNFYMILYSPQKLSIKKIKLNLIWKW
uniref:ATP synthase F0 subunit 8 n=1 Tax=Curculionidae sp. 2 AH-2016 TaxID=1903828 RepID=A0A343C2N3_9CUCU|nr:ATP synthase F0 subunit 8 [Curculionidae sp. 2 AH-2016]